MPMLLCIWHNLIYTTVLVSDVCLVNQPILACLVHATSYDAISKDSHALAANLVKATATVSSSKKSMLDQESAAVTDSE